MNRSNETQYWHADLRASTGKHLKQSHTLNISYFLPTHLWVLFSFGGCNVVFRFANCHVQAHTHVPYKCQKLHATRQQVWVSIFVWFFFSFFSPQCPRFVLFIYFLSSGFFVLVSFWLHNLKGGISFGCARKNCFADFV